MNPSNGRSFSLENASVLITGGTGSFGKMFVKTLLSRYPGLKRLVIFSRDELKQFEMAQQFSPVEHPCLRYFIGDVRDAARLQRALEGIDIVVHAAALKQVPTAEYNPFECIKTNVLGAQNLIDACLDTGVSRVVALSTDKAAAPINLYGATKLCSDKLFVAANNIKGARDARFSVVRYGNVMGSRGSVIPFFLEKRKGGVLPITDPTMTRFNITLPEAVDMVLWSIENARGGEILVPKIASYRITDLAQAIGPECEHPVIGLRPGEKIHEEMITASDSQNTVDLGKYYAILPSGAGDYVRGYCERTTFQPVAPGFCYNSGTNERFLSVAELRELIFENAESVGGAPVAASASRPVELRELPLPSLEAGMLPYGRQTISEDDIAAVVAALRSDFLTQGPLIEQFERRFAEKVGARHAIAVNSATAALHLAMRVAGIGAGDRVVTSPITFLASANAAAYVGATPDFADIDPTSCTLDAVALAANWRDDTRAVVAVDYAGQACDLPAIARVARERGAIVIEDACHAVGGAFHTDAAPGQAWKIGGHPWADLTVFSFHPVKTMTTGEGGMLVTDRSDWAEHARLLRSHGIVRDPAKFSALTGESGPWLYEMQDLGYNYRLTDLQCALGLTQLDRLDAFVARRREIVAAYNAAFAGLDWLQTPRLRESADEATTSWHLYTAQIDFGALGRSRADVMSGLREAGVGSQVLYIPVHLQPWYRKTFDYGPGKCPHAENFYARALSLPLFPTMTDADVARVIEAVRALAPVPVPS